jgi:MFS family permease
LTLRHDGHTPPPSAPEAPLSRLRRAAIDIEPLRHARFRRIWTGQSVSVVGVQLTAVAVPVQIYALTHSSFWVGALGAVGLVPTIVFGLWGGAVADAVDRRNLAIAAAVVEWLCTVGLLLHALLGGHSLPVLLCLVAVQAAAFAVSGSTWGAVIPRILPTASVPAANTLLFTSLTTGAVAGPLLAGVVLTHGSFTVAYLIDALLFTLTLYAALRLPPLPPGPRAGPAGLRSVLDGLGFIAGRPLLLLSFAVDIAAMVLAMPKALFPEAAARFGGGSAVGWLYSSIAIGSVLAGLTSGWISRVRRQGIALVIAVVGWGLAVAAAGTTHRLWLAVLLLGLAGATDLVSAVYRQTILQTYAPDEMRGRMQGVFIVVVTGGPRLGDLRAGATAAAVGLQAAWIGGGVACVVLVLLALLAPSLRGYVAEPAAGAFGALT